MRRRVLVCGGRDFDGYAYLKSVLDLLPPDEDREFCCGGARGADALCERYCRENFYICRVYEADWDTHGKAAGPIRNQQMLDEFYPDVVIAFQGGRGTADMVNRARGAGIEILEM